MNEQIGYKSGDTIQFIMKIYKQSLIFESKNNIISINLNQPNNCCLYFLGSYLHFSML